MPGGSGGLEITNERAGAANGRCNGWRTRARHTPAAPCFLSPCSAGTALFIYANAGPKREGVADRHRDTQFRAILNREKSPLTSEPLRRDAGTPGARSRRKGSGISQLS